MPSPVENAALLMVDPAPLPVGVNLTGATQPFAQTFDRRLATGAAYQTVSGTLVLTSCWLPQGQTVTGITFLSGATGETGGQHLWFALYKDVAGTSTLMAQSTDDTGATSFGANVALRKALTTAQVCPYTGLYYLVYCSTNSAGTNPTLLSVNAAVANANGSITGLTPILSATGDTGLTTTAPATMGTKTTIVQSLYAFVD